MVRSISSFTLSSSDYIPLLASDNLSSLSALISAMDNLDDLCQTVEEKYAASLQDDKYELWVEKS
jgi:hypothetical protein